MSRRTPTMPRWWYLGPLVLFIAVMVSPIGQSEAAPVPGSQGTDTTLPPTPSQVTVSGRGAFADLRITINQTADLTNQAVSISWTGGTPTRQGPGDFAAHFLQVFQCWGDDDGTNPANPGPPPEQCQQGAVGGQPGGVSGTSYPNGFAMSRIVSRTSFPGYRAGMGVVDRRDGSGNVWLPFRAVDGTVVDFQSDPLFNPSLEGGNFWLNPYYNIVTTNEIVAGRTGRDGRGSDLFQVTTGLEAPGLGCGQRRIQRADGTRVQPRCWIVVVPRGDPRTENVGMGTFEDQADQSGVMSSPLAPEPWKNRIAIPLEFKPVESACELAAVERRVAGSELVMAAVSSWQPVVCGELDLPPLSYANVPEPGARQQLASAVPGGPGMVVVSRPLAKNQETAASPAVYAPLAVSGIVIGFNVERAAKIDAPPEQVALNGVRIAQLNLTPRLVAKLLTQSYRSQVFVANADPGYPWARANPYSLTEDPDFLRFNPEFELLSYLDRLFGGLQLPAGASDVATQVWEWILADAEAKAWLDGAPDEWGMRVNPVYATTAAANSNGVPFAASVPTSFPKADPFCYQGPTRNGIVPPPLCGTDWMPYTRNLREGAQFALAGNDPARISENVFANAASEVWRRNPPQSSGRRVMLSLTDSASAQRFGLPMARLSRAGDNGASRQFIAPTIETLTAGVGAMRTTTAGFLEPDPLASAAGAYPLTAISWAAVKPLSIDTATRSDLAAFVRFATGAGQTPGLDFGQLPRGYAPLPTALTTLATAAAEQIVSLQPPAPPATTPTTAPPAPPATDAPAQSASASPNITPAPVAAAPPTGSAQTRPQSSSGSSGSRPASGSASTPTTEAVVEDTVTPETTVDTVADEPAADEGVDSEDVAPEAAVPSTTTPAPALTPGLDVSLSRFVVAIVSALLLLSALFALELTKRARRAEFPDEPDADDMPSVGPHAPSPLAVVPTDDATWAKREAEILETADA